MNEPGLNFDWLSSTHRLVRADSRPYSYPDSSSEFDEASYPTMGSDEIYPSGEKVFLAVLKN